MDEAAATVAAIPILERVRVVCPGSRALGEKNKLLKAERGISFEDIVFHIQAGDIIETFEHPNQKRYPGQQIHAIGVEGYVYLVPFGPRSSTEAPEMSELHREPPAADLAKVG